MNLVTAAIVLVLISITTSDAWFFESPEHPTRREDELPELSDLNQEDLDAVQLFLTYKPYFLEYARQQMLRKRNPIHKRSVPFTIRQRTER